MKKAIKNILMLSIALVSVCIISQTDVSAASIGIDPGTPKRAYYNVYSTPYSDITYPNLRCTSWFDKAYYLVVKSNGGQGKIDMSIQGLWGATAEFTGTQEGSSNGVRLLIYRFPNGITCTDLQYLLRNYFYVHTEAQQTNPFEFSIHIETDSTAGANDTGQYIEFLQWDQSGLYWAYDETYTVKTDVNIKCRDRTQCDYDWATAKKEADYHSFSLEANSTKPGSVLVSAHLDPKYPSENCYFLVYVDGEVLAKGSGNKSDGISTIYFSPSEGTVYTDKIDGKIGGGNWATAVDENNGVDVDTIYSTWRIKGKKMVSADPPSTKIKAYTIPKQYPVCVCYKDNYNWQSKPNPDLQIVEFTPDWIDNPSAITYTIDQAMLTKTGYTWDQKWYSAANTFKRAEPLSYSRLNGDWIATGSIIDWYWSRLAKIVTIYTKNEKPNEYDVVFNDNGSWNTPGTSSQHMIYDQTYDLNSNRYTRYTGEKSNGALVLDGYSFSGWTTFQDQSGNSPTLTQSQDYTIDGTNRGLTSSDLLGNNCSVKNLTATNNGTINLYPNFEKTVTVSIGLNSHGATYRGDNTATRSRSYTFYNRESTIINLSDLTQGNTAYGAPSVTSGDWKKSNGLNRDWSKETIATNQGEDRVTAYRMLGFSKNPWAGNTEWESLYPTSTSYNTLYNFSTYSNNHANQLEIVNDINLYVLWEPELTLQSSATGAGIKSVTTPISTRSTGAQYLDLKLPAGTKITTEHLADGLEPFQGIRQDITITKFYPQKFADMYTPAFQSQYPTLTDKLNTTQTFQNLVTKETNIQNTYRENEIFSIPTYLDTAEYNRLTGQAYDKNAIYRIKYSVEQPSEFTALVYGEESEIVSTELRLQLPTANTEPGGGGGGGGTGGGGGADNTPNKVKLHLNLHTKDETH